MLLLVRYLISLCLLIFSGLTFYFLYRYLKVHQEDGEIAIGDVEIGIGIGLVALLELLLSILYFIDGKSLEYMYKEPIFLIPLLLVGSYFVVGLILNYQDKKNKTSNIKKYKKNYLSNDR